MNIKKVSKRLLKGKYIVLSLLGVFIIMFSSATSEFYEKKVDKYINYIDNASENISEDSETNVEKVSKTNVEKVSKTKSTTLSKKKINTIKLARVNTKTIETIDIETYIEGVVAAEVPSTFEIEALKAQAVASRGVTFSRVVNSSKHRLYDYADLCDNYACCQGYSPDKVNNTIKKVVADTKGYVPLLDGKVAPTLYFASTMNGTLTDEDVWGKKTEYTDMYRENKGPSPDSNIMKGNHNEYPYTSADVTMSISDFIKSVNIVYPKVNLTKENIKDNVKVISRTIGNYVDKFKLGDLVISGSEVRQKLVTKLKSANFTVSFYGENIIFTTKGNGHGVGMSQWGANALAKQGKNFTEILNYYFKNISIKQVY